MNAFTRIVALTAVAMTLAATSADAQQTGKTNPNGHYADVNGIHLYYEIHGEPRGGGRPLVLLHGGLGAIEMFGPNLPALAKGHQVIALDLYGHGRTALTDRPFDLASMADDVAALLKQLKIEKADVMGYSLGAGVALQTAIRHPEVVNKVVAVSTIARREAFYPDILKQQQGVNAQAAEMMKQTPMYAMYASIAPRPQDFPKLLEAIGGFMQKAPDFTADIAKITAPVMFVQGDADIVPPTHALELFASLGGGQKDGGWDRSGVTKHRLAILPGLTHYDIFTDTMVSSVAIRFLDEGVTQAGK